MLEKKITVSIVSHGHCTLVLNLLRTLIELQEPSLNKIVVTINHPGLDVALVQELRQLVHELCCVGPPQLELTWCVNSTPLGFSANHNKAFAQCTSEYFLVLNPDISFDVNPFPLMLSSINELDAAMVYPAQTDTLINLLDFERELVTPFSLLRRYANKLLSERFQGTRRSKSKSQMKFDWASGSFMLFKSDKFKYVNGFDERYFMYCEDVDICLRMQIKGYSLVKAPCSVIHNSQRQTLKNRQHLFWHAQSLLKLWSSSSFWRFLLRKIKH